LINWKVRIRGIYSTALTKLLVEDEFRPRIAEFTTALKKFADEVIKLLRLRSIEIVPTLTPLLTETWSLILNYHIYEADALQLSACSKSRSDAFLSGDKGLVNIARKVGLKAFDVSTEEKEAKQFLNNAKRTSHPKN